ncbi:MAG: nitroreductase family protein [Bacteroidota bacterium]|nr:nitroreductase family protein [Bacteroidota bacterium]
MSFLDIAKKRYSCRKYKDKPIEKEKLAQVLEAGRIAPSAKNTQPWNFIIIRKKENLERLSEAYQRSWLKSAPVVIAVCGDHRQSWRRADGKKHTDIDVSSAISYMTLAAADLGLATCWICKFDVMKSVELLQLRDDMEPIALIPIGYPDNEPDTERFEQERKPIDEIVHYERFFYKDFKR